MKLLIAVLQALLMLIAGIAAMVQAAVRDNACTLADRYRSKNL